MIDNKQAVRFTNEKIRPVADKIAEAYFTAKQVKGEWYANNVGAVLPPSADKIADGSEKDGRHPLTGSDATLIITRCEELIADLEKDNNAKLNTILKAAVNY